MNPRVAIGSATAVVALASPVVIHFEGNKDMFYKDPVGIVTVCVGHTGSDIVQGKRYTAAECSALLARDLAEHNAGMLRCVRKDMPDHVHAAMLSFTFNVGVGAFCKSTMAKKINAGDFEAACNELPKWIYAGGRPLPGLVKRRAAEQALCEGRPWK